MQSYMITGDNHTTARIVAEQLGIHNVMAEVTPAGKADKVIGFSILPTPYLKTIYEVTCFGKPDDCLSTINW